MELTEVIGGVRDSLTAKRVYGEPYQQNGLTVIPAAKVRGGGGGGGGESPEGGGSGGGFGITASPSGAWVIADGEVTWKPVVDVTRIAVMTQVVVLAGFLTIRAIVRERARRRGSIPAFGRRRSRRMRR